MLILCDEVGYALPWRVDRILIECDAEYRSPVVHAEDHCCTGVVATVAGAFDYDDRWIVLFVEHVRRAIKNLTVECTWAYTTYHEYVFDQDYFYQYDAWGRLVQVNRMLGMTAADFDGEGRLLGSAAGHVGDLVAHYSYDGLGRLIVKTVLTAPGSSTRQHQHHYYDGVRRVQEQFHTESSGGGGTWTTKREYIYGSDYVDEYILQHHSPAGGVGGSSPVVYMLQDANYNVVATLDGGASTGCGGGTGGNGCGSGGDGSGGGGADEIGVYEQYTHEPYGQLAALDKFITTPPQNPVGHQGLFYDHYCATSPSAPCLQVAHKGLYQNRNRFYHPKLGRFTTPDPNSSAILLIEGAAYHGMPPTALAVVGSGALSQYSPMGQFGDGMNIHVYATASPCNKLDPSGLFNLLDLTAATGIRGDLSSDITDAGMTLAQSVAGLAGFASYRSLLLDDMSNTLLTSSDTMKGLELVLTAYDAYQKLQMAQFAAGVLRAGLNLSRAGFAALVGARPPTSRSFKSFAALKHYLGPAGRYDQMLWMT